MKFEDYLPCEAYSDRPESPDNGFVSFYEEASSQHYFAWLDEEDNSLLFISEGYPQPASRDNGIQSVMKNRDKDERYALKQADNGKFYLSLKAGNHQEIARSCFFDTELQALALMPSARAKAKEEARAKREAEAAAKLAAASAVAASSASDTSGGGSGSSDREADNYLACSAYEGHTESPHPGFTIFKSEADGQHYFAWVSANGRVLMRSEGYPTTAARDNGLQSVIKNREIRGRFSVKQYPTGHCYVILKAGNHQEIARSCAYRNEAEANEAFPILTADAQAATTATTSTTEEAIVVSAAAPVVVEAATSEPAAVAAAPVVEETTVETTTTTTTTTVVEEKVEVVHVETVAPPIVEVVKVETKVIEDDYMTCNEYLGHTAGSNGIANFKHANGKYYFVWLDGNGKIILRSEGFDTADARQEELNLVLKHRNTEERYTVIEKKGHRMRILKDETGREIGRSCLEKVVVAAPAAPIVETAAVAATVVEAPAPVVEETKVEATSEPVAVAAAPTVEAKKEIEDDYLPCKEYEGKTVNDKQNNVALFKHDNGQYYFVLYNENGGVRLRSEGFEDAKTRDSELSGVLRNLNNADLYKTIERGPYRMHILYDKTGREVGRSCLEKITVAAVPVVETKVEEVAPAIAVAAAAPVVEEVKVEEAPAVPVVEMASIAAAATIADVVTEEETPEPVVEAVQVEEVEVEAPAIVEEVAVAAPAVEIEEVVMEEAPAAVEEVVVEEVAETETVVKEVKEEAAPIVEIVAAATPIAAVASIISTKEEEKPIEIVEEVKVEEVKVEEVVAPVVEEVKVEAPVVAEVKTEEVKVVEVPAAAPVVVVKKEKEDDYLPCKEYEGRNVNDKQNNVALFKHDNGQFYFVMYNANGSVRLRSEGFEDARRRDSELTAALKNINNADMYKTIERGDYHMKVLYDKDGREVGRSCLEKVGATPTPDTTIATAAAAVTAAAVTTKIVEEKEEVKVVETVAPTIVTTETRVEKTIEDDYLVCDEYKGHKVGANNIALFKHSNGQYYFVWYDKNGKILLRSEGFKTEKERQVELDLVLKHRNNEKLYNVVEKKGYQMRILNDEKGREIGRSCLEKVEAKAPVVETVAAAATIATAAAAITRTRKVSREEDDYLSCSDYEGHKIGANSIARFTHKNGKKYFVWYDKNGKVALRSEGFATDAELEDELKAVLKYRDDKKRYETVDKLGYRLHVLKDADGREIGRTCLEKIVAAAPIKETAAAAAAVEEVAAPVAAAEASGCMRYWWLLPLLLIPLFFWWKGCDNKTAVVTPPPVEVKKDVPPPVAPTPAPVEAACACNNQTDPVFKIDATKTPKSLHRLGTNPEFGNSHNLTPAEFYEKLASKAKSSSVDKAFLNRMFKAMGYANGFADAKPEMFSAVELPAGTVGNIGYSKAHKTLYCQLDTQGDDLKAFRIKAANGCDLHFMKTCGNHMFFCTK